MLAIVVVMIVVMMMVMMVVVRALMGIPMVMGFLDQAIRLDRHLCLLHRGDCIRSGR